MQFKQFLLNEAKNIIIEIDKKTAVQTIKNNCKDFLNLYKKSKNLLYRGSRSTNGSFSYGDSSKGTRKSKNTENYYTLIIDNSSDWKQYPKRSKSFICTTSKNYAGDYGIPNLVFPKDGTSFGICPKGDIWNSFKTVEYDLEKFNSYIGSIGHAFDVKILDDTNENFKNSLLKLSKKINSKKFDSYNDYKNYFVAHGDDRNLQYDNYKNFNVSRKFYENSDNIYKFLSSLLKPTEFKLQTTSNFSVVGSGGKEVWFSGPAVFVNLEEYGALKTFMENF